MKIGLTLHHWLAIGLATVWIASLQAAPSPATEEPVATTGSDDGPIVQATAQSTDQPTAQSKAQPSIQSSAQRQAEAELDALLAEVPDADDYGTASRCLPRHQIQRVEILSDRMVLFHGRRKQLWLNQFRHKCAGLRRRQIVVLEPRGASLCALDSISGRDRIAPLGGVGGGSVFGSARCSLANFETISAEQVELLKLAIENDQF